MATVNLVEELVAAIEIVEAKLSEGTISRSMHGTAFLHEVLKQLSSQLGGEPFDSRDAQSITRLIRLMFCDTAGCDRARNHEPDCIPDLESAATIHEP